MHKFKVGDFASTCHLSDRTPVVVTHVNASGKTVTVRRVQFDIKPGHAEFGKDYGRDDVENVTEIGSEETYRFTNRKREGGLRFRGPGGTLSAGFSSYRDPHY